MTKAVYRRECILAYGSVGIRIHDGRTESRQLEWVRSSNCTMDQEMVFKVSNPPTEMHLLQQGHTSQSSPNSSTNWGLSIEIHQLIRNISYSNHQSECV